MLTALREHEFSESAVSDGATGLLPPHAHAKRVSMAPGRFIV